MKSLYLVLALLLSTSVVLAEEMSFEEIDRDPAGFDREIDSQPWHVESKGGAMVCVPPPVTKKRVRRKVMKKVAAPACEPKTVVKTVEVEKQVEKVVEKTVVEEAPKNRIRLMGGQGLSTTDLKTNPSLAIFSKTYGVVGGVGYERSLTKRWSVGAELLTNPTWLLSVGYSF